MQKNQVLFDIKIKKEKYYIVLTKENKLIAVYFDNGNRYITVNDEKKIYNINKIIKILNEKYIRRKSITYDGKKVERFINIYTQKSYFAKKDHQGELIKCTYDEYKNLYNIYNGVQTVYLINKGFDSNTYKSNSQTQHTGKNRQTIGPKNRVKQIALGLTGIAVSISISFPGWNFLREAKISEVIATTKAMEIEVTDEVYSEDVEFVIDVINNNPNLQESEKKYIISTYASIWEENSQYINFYELASKYRNLQIIYDDSLERGNSQKSDKTNNLLGKYDYDGPLVFTMEEYEKVGDNRKSSMTIYGADSIEEVLLDEEKRNTLNHELNHLNGGYSFYGEIGMELQEGYTEFSTPNLTSRTYKGGRLMNIIFIETFGIDTIKEGYYGYNLQSCLTNRIVEKTGRNAEEVDSEVSTLLEDTNILLIGLGSDDRSKEENDELKVLYNSICSRLENYYKIINNKEYMENQAICTAMDWFKAEHNADIYLNGNEYIDDIIEYDTNTGELTVQLKQYVQESPDSTKLIETGERRTITIDENNKIKQTNMTNDIER